MLGLNGVGGLVEQAVLEGGGGEERSGEVRWEEQWVDQHKNGIHESVLRGGAMYARCCGALCAVQLLHCCWDGSYCIAASVSVLPIPIPDKANIR